MTVLRRLPGWQADQVARASRPTCTWAASASAVTPTNIVTAIPPSSASVVAAFLLFGGLNAGTPLLIASTPVSAVQPEAKARSSRKTSASAGVVRASS